MQETRNSCFGSKKHNTTLRQVKTFSGNPLSVFCCIFSTFVLTLFRVKCCVMFYRTKTIITDFFHSKFKVNVCKNFMLWVLVINNFLLRMRESYFLILLNGSQFYITHFTLRYESNVMEIQKML